jgi:hypothetical protein
MNPRAELRTKFTSPTSSALLTLAQMHGAETRGGVTKEFRGLVLLSGRFNNNVFYYFL